MIYKALFLDRDGVINVDKGYAYKIKDIEFIQGIEKLIKKAKIRNYKVICVTNQSGIARGFFNEDDLHKFMSEINTRLEKSIGYKLDLYLYCPHHPSAKILEYRKSCSCRKPKNGLFLQAKQIFPIDFKKSIFIGDKITDIKAAQTMKFGKLYLLSNKKIELKKVKYRQISNLSEVNIT